MARGACTFRQQDVTRALRAAKAAGETVQRIEIDKSGKIVVVTGQPETEATRAGGNEWDKVK